MRIQQKPSFAPKLRGLLLVIFMSVLSFAPESLAENAFSWQDKQGRTFYGSQPPKDALSVKKLKTNNLSRYSSDKVLKRLGWDEQQAKAKEAAEIQNQAPSADLPISASPALLEPGEPNVAITDKGDISSCSVEVKNLGETNALEISIAFEFTDGTLVPGVGPAAIEGNAAAEYVVPAELLPFSVSRSLEEDISIAPVPKVIIHGVAG